MRSPKALAAALVALAALSLIGLSIVRPETVAGLPIDVGAILDAIDRANRTDAPRGGLDPADRSAGHVEDGAPLVDPALGPSVATRPPADQPAAPPGAIDRPPRYTLSGYASFYDRGSTAMRLPRGTLVVICGDGGCIERTVTDYGPNAAAHPERVADLYRGDFFAICGCPMWSGTTWVTVKVY